MVKWSSELEDILASVGIAHGDIVAARNNVEELIADRNRKVEVANELADALSRTPGIDAAWEIAGDVSVEGRLSAIMEFAQEWRSEIEELS